MPPQQKGDPYASLPDVGASDPYASLPDVAAAPVGDTRANISAQHPSGNIVQQYIDRLSTVSPSERVSNQSSAFAPLVNVAQQFGADVIGSTAGALVHPIQTARGMVPERDPSTGNLTTTGKVETVLGPAAAPIYNTAKSIYQTLKGKSLEEAIPSLAGQAIGGALTGEAVSGVMGLAPRVFRSPANASPHVMRDLVKDTQTANAADAAKVAGENKTAAVKHLEDTQSALHETAGREMTHAQTLKSVQEEAAKKRKAQLSEHAAAKSKAESARQAAQAKYESATTAQKKIAPTEQKLRSAWSDLRAGIETARNNALKIGNDKYNAVHEQLNEFPADMDKVGGAYSEALSSFGETQAIPPLLARVEKAFKVPETIEGGGEVQPLTYADEQKLYSDLGKELSKGTLPGSTFHAYDMLQEAVGEDMQRIANAHGMGAELTDARNYWRRMKQTFGKPLTMRDAATGTLKGSASGLAAEDALQNQMRLLGSFDPAVPKQYAHVQNIEKGVESLPKPVPARELTQKLAESRPAIPQIPKAEPAKVPAPPERVAPPDRPPEKLPAPKKIGEEEIKAAKESDLTSKAKRVQHRVMWAAVTPTLFAIDQIVRFHGLSPTQIGSAAGATAGMVGVGSLVTKLFENPSFAKFMTDATPHDVAAIPPELRGSFPAIVKQAQSQGIKVSPSLLGIGAMGVAPRKHPSDTYAGQ